MTQMCNMQNDEEIGKLMEKQTENTTFEEQTM
jgi:hypothetical protein